MKRNGLNIAFTGGGTGGHIQPIVSLIEYAQNHSEIISKCKNLYWFGEQGGQEQTASRLLSGVQFVSIASGKIRRYRDIASIMKNIGDMGKVVRGFFQSVYYLKKHNIDIIFCKGGHVALPVCLAAALLRKKIVMHESDMHAGLTNRLVAKVATTKFVGFADTFPDEIVVGQILSDRLTTYVTSTMDNSLTHVLVMGGSQGASAIFESLQVCIEQGIDTNYHFHVLLGTKNQSFQTSFAGCKQVTTYGFLDQHEIAGLYALCDLAITRGSVTSLQEQQLFGLKKIIIPLPWTGGNHQFHNAVWYSDTYEDIVLEQSEQLTENLGVFLQKLSGWKKEWAGINAEELEIAKKNVRIYLLE